MSLNNEYEKKNSGNISDKLILSPVIKKEIGDEMKISYISYAMSVIIGRALPDVRDGLKSVHRRILYSMNESGNTNDKPFKKSARIVGNVLGKYHPHGDSSVYDAIVRMVQPFSLRYPLINGQGNFGSIDGDSAAAMRYTEVKLHSISEEMMKDLNKDTVTFKDNYDGSLKEPTILPAKLPNLLINGATGIAVGMATNMPPHNLCEVIDAIIYFIENRDIVTIDDLMKIIKGPDFPTGGIVLNYDGLKKAYETGKGVIKIRGVYEIEESKYEKKKLVITELPYQVNKSKLVENIARCIREKLISGVSDLRDESNRDGIRIVLDLSKGTNENIILNLLYKHTQMEISFGIINLAIVDSIPKILNLYQLIELYVIHRLNIIDKRTKYELQISKKRVHILQGLKVASSNIYDIINIIKKTTDTNQLKIELRNKYNFDDEQIKSILDLKLQKLTTIEVNKIDSEISDYLSKIEEYNKILNFDYRKLEIIKNELLEIKSKFGDKRKSVISMSSYDIEKNMDCFVKEEEILITLTCNGYIKRLPVNTYTKQNRGGKGIIGIEVNDKDSVKSMFVTSTHDYILFFTNKGRVYSKKAYEIQESTRVSKGKALVNLLDLNENETITTLFPVKDFDDNSYLLFLTKNGLVKKVLLSEFKKTRKSGIIAILLNDNDKLVSVKKTTGNNNVIFVSYFGKALCVNESEIRTSRRVSKGVIGIKLAKNDYVVGMEIVNEKDTLFTLTKNGFGKKTEYKEYIQKHRNTYGVKTAVINERNGPVACVLSVSNDDELIITSLEGITIRIEASKISCLKRNTQGIKIMSLNKGDFISSVAKIRMILE